MIGLHFSLGTYKKLHLFKFTCIKATTISTRMFADFIKLRAVPIPMPIGAIIEKTIIERST